MVKPNSSLLLHALIAFGLSAGLTAQQKKAVEAAPFDLQDGDTLVFLGDSITHQCLYTQYVEDFFFTRYPDRKIQFHNSGVSGDRAINALDRFDADVAEFHPKVVTVLLGMNDGAYEDFDASNFEAYSRDMTILLDQIGKTGATPIVMSPTMFDHHQLALQMENPDYRFRTRSFSPQYNSLLAYYGGWLRERAGERQLSFVDQWAPMNQHTFAERRDEPDFTLVPDAIHPAPAGHFLMAFELLSQVNPDRKSVSSISIVPGGKGWRGGADVSELVVSDGKDKVTFTHLARSLPWVVPAEAWKGDAKWDAEPGALLGYQMTVAGHKLRSKVELQSNAKTPQYQQALQVAEMNRERNDLAIRPLRDLWAGIKGIRAKAREAVAAGNPDPFEAQFAAKKVKIDELLELGRSYEEKIRAAAQPKARKYEVVRVP
jgi:lysophospholipase L1-like esterase